MHFSSVDLMIKLLDFGKHEFQTKNSSTTLKLKNFAGTKFRIFFCPNINPSKILSCPKLFPAKIFRKWNFSFFFGSNSNENQYRRSIFRGKHVGKKKKKKEHNTVEMMYMLCI